MKYVIYIAMILACGFTIWDLAQPLPTVQYSYTTGLPKYIEWPDGHKDRVGVNTKLPDKYEKEWIK